jgi:hypothetical protein
MAGNDQFWPRYDDLWLFFWFFWRSGASEKKKKNLGIIVDTADFVYKHPFFTRFGVRKVTGHCFGTQKL